jgi:hypothetical protein
MQKPSAECRDVRNRLLDLALASRQRAGGATGSREPLPPEAEDHLMTCPACRRYREGLSAASWGGSTEPLYTPALRRRTLAAAERELERPAWLAPLLVPASLAAIATSLLAPIWLLAALLRPVLGSEGAALGLSLAFSLSAGLAAILFGLVVLERCRRENTIAATSGRFIREVFGD